jgi:ABC-2 type transport system ATP-binding protein
LTKHYKGVAALTDLTLEVPAGSVFGFLGPNGAGKTTTLKILARLARPTSGGAVVNGVPVTPQGLHRREIGYLAQTPQFYGWITGRETLRYVGRYYGPDPNCERRIGELLDRVAIADAADRKTSTYSGGMRQRLGIADTLVGRPAVIVLDEPVSALDSIGPLTARDGSSDQPLGPPSPCRPSPPLGQTLRTGAGLTRLAGTRCRPTVEL